LDKMEVEVEVNENDIVKVALNDTALVEVDAYLQRDFKGIVTEIANSASTTGTATDQVTNFDVKVFLLSDSYANLIDSVSGNIYPFRPGMSATVDIMTETRENVISVPIAAVTTRIRNEDAKKNSGENQETDVVDRDEKKEVVFVHKGGIVRQVEVKTGIQDNESIEILEGVSEGDEIVIAPYNAINKTLKDSLKVKVVAENELYKTDK